MDKDPRFGRGYVIPALASLLAFSAFNAVCNHPVVYKYLPHFSITLGGYLVAGSGLALALLYGAARAGRVTQEDLGLGLSGWMVPRRLIGLVVVVLVGYGGFAVNEKPPSSAPASVAAEGAAPQGPVSEAVVANGPLTWGEYCLWYVILLSASLAELLVFLSMGFCLLRRGLRERGLGRFSAAAIAAAVACVSFGLYHFTYEPRWHPYAVPLMAEMFLVVLFFVGTRNFYLTLLLHNTLATMGFVGERYSPDPIDLGYFSEPLAFTTNLIAFLVPFLLLHVLEWQGGLGPRPPGERLTG